MAQRDVRLIIKKRETTGGSVPGSALMGEPFANLFDGKMFFSATTGGSYEPSSQSGVFEVGSKLYNQKITNRLSINDNFIVSGDTGIISTYNGLNGASLSGKFLSGTSAGFVVANISDIQGVQTLVQNGTNIFTGGSATYPTINLVASPSVNNITYSGTSTGGNSIATNVSATTFYSAATNLETIIYNIAASTENTTAVQPGSNITTGGTQSAPVINLAASPSVNNITFSGTAIGGTVQAAAATFTSVSGGTVSGGTLYSGSTDIYNIFAKPGLVVNNVNAGSNITTGGTAISPTINLAASPSINNLSFSGIATGGAVNATSLSATSLTNTRVLFAGANGLITDDAGMTYNSGTDVLTVNGNLTTNGTQYSGGTIVDDGVFIIDAATSVQLDSIFLPTTHLSYDIGAVGQRWNRVYARSFHAGIASTVYGDGYITGDTATFVFDSGNLSVNGSIRPSATTVYDLGTSGLRWSTYYGKDMDLTGALSVTGITNSSLTAGQAVYAGTGGLLKSHTGFTYDDTTSQLFTQNIQVGSSSLSGNVTIWGDVTVHGQSISAFTSQLYIEDNNIILNYNPTASTTSTSLGAGWTIQDGTGVAGTDVFLDIRGTGSGVTNRGLATNLYDIYIRESGTTSSPNGMRVLAEQDILNGGTF